MTDPDNSLQLYQRPTCTLASTGDSVNFAIEGQSPNYELALHKDVTLDYEKKKVYAISITCNDHGTPPLSITKGFMIMVQGIFVSLEVACFTFKGLSCSCETSLRLRALINN